MLSQELQNEIEIEIQKSPKETQDFLHDKYFSETINLISRVNKLDQTQSDALYLETIMEILGLNDYKDFNEAIKNQIKIEDNFLPDENIKQIVSDVNSYIFSKIQKNAVTPVGNIIIQANQDNKTENKSTLRDTISQELKNNKNTIEYLSRPNLSNAQEIPTFAVEGDKTVPKIETNLIENSPEYVENKEKNIPTPTKEEAIAELGDVYREKPDEVDKVIKHE
jgi:hypothetical protein